MYVYLGWIYLHNALENFKWKWNEKQNRNDSTWFQSTNAGSGCEQGWKQVACRKITSRIFRTHIISYVHKCTQAHLLVGRQIVTEFAAITDYMPPFWVQR